MNNINNPNTITNAEQVNNQEQQENQINLLELWYNILNKWYIFVFAVIVAVIIAFLVNRYSSPKYEATASLLIKPNDGMLDLGLDGFTKNNSNQEFQNAIGTIQSFTMTKRTLKAMDLYCDYYERVNLRNVDIYKANPFEVVLDPSQETQPTGILIKVDLFSPTSCKISYSSRIDVPLYDYVEDNLTDKKVNVASRTDVKLNYNQWYTLDGMRFKVKLKQPWTDEIARGRYSFKINDFDALARDFNTTKIDLINKESSIVTIKYRHQNQKKAVDFINMLCKIFIDQTFEEKNYLNVATIDFVNSQISSIGDSLSRAERQKQDFQQTNNILSMTKDGEFLYDRTNTLQEKKAEEYTRQQYYSYLSDYLDNADLDEGVASPLAMGVEDKVFNELIAQLSEAIVEHKTLADKRSDKNPKTQELRIRIQTLRKQISESLKNLKNVSDINMRELQRQQNHLQVQIDKLPSAERSMVNIERQFKFNDEIYTFLYQKRSEAEIAKNAALPDHKVVDKAITAIKVSPKSLLNYLVAFLLGILIPGLYIFLKYITKDTIDNKDDLAKISPNPILGYIPEFPKEYNRMIVFDKPRSQVTEAYRSIRTNIKYILGESKEGEPGKVIMITSSMPGEGKSLTSFNISSVFSITDNKTLLVEYDLRKPRLAKMLNLNASVGISTYYIGQTSLQESIQHSEFDNLDVMCVGPTPPNPSEIVDSQKNKDMIEELRKHYDYVILDTPPVNLIADAQTLAKQADITLFVVRVGVTSTSILNVSLTEIEQRNGIKVNFILNGIQNIMQKYGYGKGYGYGYGKGYGYGYGKGYGYGEYIKEYSYGYFDDKPTENKSNDKHSKKSKDSKK